MLVRVSEIEVHAEALEGYKAILEEEAADSIRLEPGVIAILPMYERERPTQVRILEIYATDEAYRSHLETPHFRNYKVSTLSMVRSLRLVDMETVDPSSLASIFTKAR